nr:protein indeterminate-domain 2-like [Ipomoea trifida]
MFRFCRGSPRRSSSNASTSGNPPPGWGHLVSSQTSSTWVCLPSVGALGSGLFLWRSRILIGTNSWKFRWYILHQCRCWAFHLDGLLIGLFESLQCRVSRLELRAFCIHDLDAEVMALSAKSLLAMKDLCARSAAKVSSQNLKLHRRSHNLPSTLKQKDGNKPKRRLYVCPETTSVACC